MSATTISSPSPLVFQHKTIDLPAYLGRINYSGDQSLSKTTLKGIHLAHTLSIPFENLNPFLRYPVMIDIDSIQEKFVNNGRGGYCFEHNTLFAQALLTLGFSVKKLAARVLWNVSHGLTPPRGHMLLLVTVDQKTFIADTGFGGLTLPEPLEFVTNKEQQTSHEVFRIVGKEEFLLEVKLNNEWKPLYQFGLQEYTHSDYEVINYYLSTHNNSHFLHNLLMARVGIGKRMTLRNHEFAIHNLGGETVRRNVTELADLKDIIRNTFSITLPNGPDVDERLQSIVDKARQ